MKQLQAYLSWSLTIAKMTAYVCQRWLKYREIFFLRISDLSPNQTSVATNEFTKNLLDCFFPSDITN